MARSGRPSPLRAPRLMHTRILRARARMRVSPHVQVPAGTRQVEVSDERVDVGFADTWGAVTDEGHAGAACFASICWNCLRIHRANASSDNVPAATSASAFANGPTIATYFASSCVAA